MNIRNLLSLLLLLTVVFAATYAVFDAPARGDEEGESESEKALRLAVEKGKALFAQVGLGTAEKSCASCHARPDRPKMNLGPRVGDFPKYERREKRVITLGQKINIMIQKMVKGEERTLGSEELVALEAYLMSLSRAE